MSYKQALDAGLVNNNTDIITATTVNADTVNSITDNTTTLNATSIIGNIETGLTLTAPFFNLSVGGTYGNAGEFLMSNASTCSWQPIPQQQPITANITSNQYVTTENNGNYVLPTDWNTSLALIYVSFVNSTPIAFPAAFIFDVQVIYSNGTDTISNILSAPFNFNNATTGVGAISVLIYPQANNYKPISFNVFIPTQAGQTISGFTYRVDNIRLS